MTKKLQIYRRITGRDPMLCKVSDKLFDIPDSGNTCEKTVALYVMAPVMCMYIAWVLREACAAGIKRLYFMARDGYSMYETARIFCEKMKLPIECRYLYCSRYAWRTAEYHLLKEDSLSYICLGGIDVNFQKLMSRAGLTDREGKEIARLIGLEKSYEEPLNYRRLHELRKLLADCKFFMEKMSEKSRCAYPFVTGYLQQEGLLDPVKWALVDSGWTGSMQKSLQHLLGTMGYEGKVEGYYFGMYEYPDGADINTYHCWYFSPVNGLRKKIYFSNNLFECIFSSPEGMTVGYGRHEKVYCALMEKRWNPNWEKVVRTVTYLKKYAEELSEFSEKSFLFDSRQDKKCKKIAFSLLKSFMGRPDKREAEEFGRYVFCDDIIGEKNQRVAAELNLKQIRENRFLHKIANCLKKNSCRIRESAWLEGSIARSGIAVTELWHCRVYKHALYLRKLVRNYIKRMH